MALAPASLRAPRPTDPTRQGPSRPGAEAKAAPGRGEALLAHARTSIASGVLVASLASLVARTGPRWLRQGLSCDGLLHLCRRDLVVSLAPVFVLSRRRGSRIGLRAGAVTDTLNVTEVYRLLKQAPTTRHALQLASRLRKAARDGKRTKEGRMLDPGIVDEALDVLLENNARLRIPVKKVQSIYDEDEDDEELSNPFARRKQDAPWAEEAFPEAAEAAEAGDPTLLAQAAAAEEAEDRAEEFGREEVDPRSFAELPAEEMEEPEEPKEPKAPPRWKSGSSPETENEEDDGDVPYELWEQAWGIFERRLLF